MGASTKNLARCINSVLANLLFNYGVQGERYTAYDRTDTGYPAATRYNPFQIKLRGVIALFDECKVLGYVENYLGFSHPVNQYGRKSRLRATPAMTEGDSYPPV